MSPKRFVDWVGGTHVSVRLAYLTCARCAILSQRARNDTSAQIIRSARFGTHSCALSRGLFEILVSSYFLECKLLVISCLVLAGTHRSGHRASLHLRFCSARHDWWFLCGLISLLVRRSSKVIGGWLIAYAELFYKRLFYGGWSVGITLILWDLLQGILWISRKLV